MYSVLLKVTNIWLSQVRRTGCQTSGEDTSAILCTLNLNKSKVTSSVN